MTKIKIAIIDSDENNRGYKVDTFWTLAPPETGCFKPHEFRDRGIKPKLIKNLLSILNNESSPLTRAAINSGAGPKDLGDRFSVVAQDVKTSAELRRYEIVREGSEYRIAG